MSYTLSVFVVLIVALAGMKLYEKFKPLGVPEFQVDEYWGTGSPDYYTEDATIKPQEIYYTKDQIDRLITKLNDTIKFTPPLEGIFDEYGINTNELHGILNYWRDEYLPKWDERQKFFNQYQHYITEIQGLNIHFIHIEPYGELENKTVVPLLLLHGWPGSIREFYEIIPLLTTSTENSSIVFELIVPSLPGFGWSEGARRPGFGVLEMSVVLRNLMIRLKYDRFYVQGGDWGSQLGSAMATLFPENVIGYHSNMCILQTPLSLAKGFVASLYPTLFIHDDYVPFVFPVLDKIKFLVRETGFLHLQATKPDTIGAALTDNPVGLAAYILEKFSGYFDVISRESVIDNLSVYALTNSFTTSARLYAEAYSTKQLAYQLGRVQTNVPTGCGRFKNDIGHSLDWQLRDKYTNLVHSTYYSSGGHFAAMEVPELLYADLLKFVETVQQRHLK